jgi:hypothetical protein
MQHLEHNGARPLIKACTVPPETLWVNLMVEAIVRRTVISGNCIRNYYCVEVCKSCTSFASEAAACGQGYMDLMSNPAPSFVFNSSLNSFQLQLVVRISLLLSICPPKWKEPIKLGTCPCTRKPGL